MHIQLFATMVAIVAGQNIDPPVACSEDATASEIAYQLSDLPSEVRLDLMRLTRYSIGERPRPLRRSHVVIPEEDGYLGARFYRALRFQNVWYVQYELALTRGVQTIGYIGDAGGRFHASPVLRFGGPPCETIRAARAGIVAPVDALAPRPD